MCGSHCSQESSPCLGNIDCKCGGLECKTEYGCADSVCENNNENPTTCSGESRNSCDCGFNFCYPDDDVEFNDCNDHCGQAVDDPCKEGTNNHKEKWISCSCDCGLPGQPSTGCGGNYVCKYVDAVAVLSEPCPTNTCKKYISGLPVLRCRIWEAP